MPKEIPETIRLFLRKYYLGIAKRTKTTKYLSSKESASERIQKQFPRYFEGMLLEQVLDILHLPSKETIKNMIGDKVCARCGHGRNLVMEVKGSDDDGNAQSGFDIYCTAPDVESIIFSKCWYHLSRKERYGMEKWL